MRVHVCNVRMTLHRADVLEAYLNHHDAIEKATVYERTGDVVLYYNGQRADAVRALSTYKFDRPELDALVTSADSRKLNQEYQEKMYSLVVGHCFRKLFLPAPIRAAYTIWRSIAFVWKGVKCLFQRKLEVEVLDALSIGVSVLRGDFNTAGSVMFLLNLGSLLEEWTRKKSLDDLARSMALNVDKVWVRSQGTEVLLPLTKVQPGDEIVVRSGNMIPLDGTVIEGEAMINQAALTGESMPVRKIEGATVYAGTVVEEGECVFVAKAAGVQEDEVLGEDLSLYVRTRGTCLGAKNEFILAPRLDDLGCVFGLLEGFLAAKASGSVPVFCAFDNEEVGSETKQGAASSLLSDTLRRIALALGLNEEGYLRMLAQSFLVSADNAHGVHPNHPEYADMTNTPRLNGGVVIKFNANQRYTTDGVSCALFTAVCREAGAPVQVYANRSDMPGGSTLGSIATTKVSVPSVDIGLAQLAMHSCVESAGAEDLDALVKAMTCYYGKTLTRSGEQITF